MKYLITGGCGFLGSNIAHKLLQNKQQLLIFDNLSRLGSESNFKWLQSQGVFQFVKDSVSNFEVLSELIKKRNRILYIIWQDRLR